jgi:hypothetical protein
MEHFLYVVKTGGIGLVAGFLLAVLIHFFRNK